MNLPQPLRLALIDDHKLFRKGLINLIEFVNKNTIILFEADNGFEMQKKLKSVGQPEIVIMDINMPGMDGYDSVKWLSENYPAIKILVISMIQDEESIIRMLRLGVKGYLSKDVEPKELGEALISIADKGYYYTDLITGNLVHSLQCPEKDDAKNTNLLSKLHGRESEFLYLACSEYTYNEIASKMFLSPKTIDGYRKALFDKLKVKSRVGLVLFALKNELVKI